MGTPRIERVEILLPIEASEDKDAWRLAVASRLGVEPGRIGGMKLRRHSVDARQRTIKAQLSLEVSLDGPLPPDEKPKASYAPVKVGAPRLIIVGCGPAGMFAALRALELGRKPVILERGKEVGARRLDLPPILQKGVVNPESNYCFGEGGAGTFSDGKLYTRATKRGPVAKVYETFVAHGAPERILVDAHPHIGSNLLPQVVMAMRDSILEAGGEIHFGAKVVDFLFENGLKNHLNNHLNNKKMCGVVTADGREFTGEAVILATGHSARDVYSLLNKKMIRLEQKTFAMGVRIEHPQTLIDSLQYHYPLGQKRPDLLPPARYQVATNVEGRGVHSFCMCPGGFIVPTATENDEVVVNGMSLSRRDSPYANSGMVVTVEPEDTRTFQKEHGVLSGIAFQKSLEVAAKHAGGRGQVAPGQRVTDFLKGRESVDLPKTSYFPGVRSARIDELLPEWMVRRMKVGLGSFGRQMRGFLTSEAILIGFETRTSSPVRVPRDPTTLHHPEVRGLIPCGEGAGYAGGIVSAALDGMRCAEAASTDAIELSGHGRFKS